MRTGPRTRTSRRPRARRPDGNEASEGKRPAPLPPAAAASRTRKAEKQVATALSARVPSARPDETDKTAPILHRVLPDLFQRTENKPPQGSNQRKTKDYGKKAIDRTRKSGHGHADAQHSVCRIHSLHHPFLAHSLKEAPSPAAAFPQRQAAAIFLPSSRHSAYIRFFRAFRQGKRTGPAPAGTKTENKKALARDARARCFK